MKFILIFITAVLIISFNANGQILGQGNEEFIDSLPAPDPADTTTHSDTVGPVIRNHLLRKLDFETPNQLVAPWHITVPATHCYVWSQRVINDSAFHTAYCLSVHLEKDDCDASGSRRSEVDLKIVDPPNAKRMLGIGIYLKGPYTPDPNSEEIIYQWHHVENDGSPPVAVHLRGPNMYLVTRTCKANCTAVYHNLGPYVVDQYMSFVTYYNMRSDASGEVKVWVDGVLKADVTGPVAYPGIGNVLKFGLYKWGWKSSPNSSLVSVRELLNDEIYYGDELATFADVDPSL